MFNIVIMGAILLSQVCRNINRVKICMETGRTVILLNLENLYESLYDALNQVSFIIWCLEARIKLTDLILVSVVNQKQCNIVSHLRHMHGKHRMGAKRGRSDVSL